MQSSCKENDESCVNFCRKFGVQKKKPHPGRIHISCLVPLTLLALTCTACSRSLWRYFFLLPAVTKTHHKNVLALTLGPAEFFMFACLG